MHETPAVVCWVCWGDGQLYRFCDNWRKSSRKTRGKVSIFSLWLKSAATMDLLWFLEQKMLETKMLLSVSHREYSVLFEPPVLQCFRWNHYDTSRCIIANHATVESIMQIWLLPQAFRNALTMQPHRSAITLNIVYDVVLSSRVILAVCIFTWGWFSSLYWKDSHGIFLHSGRDSVLAVGSANDRSSPLANYSVSAVLAADRTPIDQIPQTQINQAIFWPEKRWIWAKADT